MAVVGAMVLTTYMASARTRDPMTFEYDAGKRAKAKAYVNLLTFCWEKTDGTELKVVDALAGKWGHDNDVNNDINEHFLNKKDFECSNGYLINEVFGFFADASNGKIKSWNEIEKDEQDDLLCDMFDIEYDGKNYSGNDCVRMINDVREGVAKATEFYFVQHASDGASALPNYLKDKIGDISKPYDDDELYYVYKGLIENYCVEGQSWSFEPAQWVLDDKHWIRTIDFEIGENGLKIRPKWSIVEHYSANAHYLAKTYVSDSSWGVLPKDKDIDCHEDNKTGLNAFIDEPKDSVVAAAGKTLIKYLKEDCRKNYDEFFHQQQEYYNALSNEQRQGDKKDYVEWFNTLDAYPSDELYCTIDWQDDEGKWPNGWQRELTPYEWSKHELFKCNVEEYIIGLLETNPDPDSPTYGGYVISVPQGGGDVDIPPEQDVCFNAGSLSWVLCPLARNLGAAIGSIYEKMVEPFLAVKPRLLGDEAHQAWRKMSEIANLVVVVFLIIIIFSQLTGVGIDNYGIKKSLPKLIVTVILVNLSFVACQIVVDVSNIAGNGINDMLSGFANSVTVRSGTCDDGKPGIKISDGVCVSANDVNSQNRAGSFRAIVDVATLGLAGVGAVSLISSVAISGLVAGLIIPILLLLVTVVVAVLFFFILLGVRQAGVVILVVLAPVAIACYMLPNTKGYFNKWWKMFSGLLVVYPICGFLIGGGQLAAKILISSSTDYITFFAGCIIMVVPFFFIPSLLKGSFAAMGNIGAKISGIGKSLGSKGRNRLDNSIKNSDRYKNRLQYNQERAALRRANRVRNRLEGRGHLNARQADRLRKAQDVVLAQNKKTAENQERNAGYFEAMGHKQALEMENERAVVGQYNRESFRNAKRAAMGEEIRKQQSKERSTLMMSGEYNGMRYDQMGLDQLQQRWEQIFRNDNNEYTDDNERVADLDALTNVMSHRYGTSAANKIGESLGKMGNVAGNSVYQGSLRQLQRTMADNTTFAGNMKNKASDAFQMISDAGMRYDQSADGGRGAMKYEDLSWFTANNSTATQVKDWATSSGATLRRAVDSGALSEDMINRMLMSDDPAIKSGLQSESGKRQILEAALYNMQHMGAGLPEEIAAQRYENEQAANAATPTIRSSGVYRTRGKNGRIVQLHEMTDGTFVDAANGQVVNIRNYKRE
jgi:hypothetical protein